MIEQWIVIGGTGMTGYRVLDTLFHKTKPKNVVATSRLVESGVPAGPLSSSTKDLSHELGAIQWSGLDLEAGNEVVVAQLAALEKRLIPGLTTALVFAAAYTNVDGCETNPEMCERINGINTRAVLAWAQERKIKIAFYSTDYVFDGAAGPYVETHPRQALCVYGQSKVDIEEWMEANAPTALIVRTTGVYDYIVGSKNFFMQMLDNLSQGRPMRIPTDQLANPVWAKELAEATVDLILADRSGIFHVAGGEQLPRIEFAKKIAAYFNLNQELITGIETASLNQKAKRPLKGGLNCEKLKSTLGWAPTAPNEVFDKIQSQYGILK